MAFARHHGAPTRLLDWSHNPFVSLWFAVSDRAFDNTDGVVFQIVLFRDQETKPSKICISSKFTMAEADNCKQGKRHHIFDGPIGVDRVKRQRGIFTISSFENNEALIPLEEQLEVGEKKTLRKFIVPARLKSEIRSLLAMLGLDAYSMYGGADGLGNSITAMYSEIAAYASHIEKRQQAAHGAPQSN